jgi:glycosyltransferase involved in cell wall biosynthesis
MHYGKIESTEKINTITVITVVRNCADKLEKTIKSVINQKYLNIEYILVDGDSSDGTKDVIAKYEQQISKWISEPDKGTYDAMNKGIRLASGEWINFMNAGDEFVHDNICNNLKEHLNDPKASVIYGDFFAADSARNTEILVKAKRPENLWHGMIFSHQSVFIRSTELKTMPFNLKYKLVSDFDQILKLYISNKVFVSVNFPISRIEISGLSYSKQSTIFELIQVIYSHKPLSPALIFFIYPLLSIWIGAIMGTKMTSKIRTLKWKLKNYIRPSVKYNINKTNTIL